MQVLECDIVIAGGGVAGLAAAAAFGSAGFRVICADPAPPVTQADAPGADLRTTAFLQPALRVLEAAGLWPALAPHAAALHVMRLVEAGQGVEDARLSCDFNAADLSDQPFGYNLPNWLLRREMVTRLGQLPNVTFLPGVSVLGMLARSSGAQVRLSNGGRVRADLVIGADGRNSPLRQAAGIGVTTLRYGQKALTFAVTHPIPHQNVSIETHLSGVPFTLVPLPDRLGQPSSAVVWMEPGAEALRLHALDTESFEQAMSERSCHVLGPLRLASQRGLWPIITHIADRFDAPRLALIAEAAHVVPPIGAQGLNMSLADTAALLELAQQHRATLGSDAMLAAYNRRRWPDVKARVTGIDLLNRTAMAGGAGLRDLRARALGMMHGVVPLRKTLMRAGLGLR